MKQTSFQFTLHGRLFSADTKHDQPFGTQNSGGICLWKSHSKAALSPFAENSFVPETECPIFTLTDRRLQAVYGRELTGIRVFLTVPSLDTGVCDQEVRRFNETAASFPSAHIYAISMDLPFAQSRWCGATGVERVQTLSDYRDHSFGIATGTRIEELGLLTRAVFLAGHDGKLAYVEYVPEITNHPDYDAALDAMRALSK